MIIIIVVSIIIIATTAAILSSAAALIAMLFPGHPALTTRCVALASAGGYLCLIPMLSVLSQR